MSNIVFHCPKCGQKIKAPGIMGGEVGECPNCKVSLIIPKPPAGSDEKAGARPARQPESPGAPKQFVAPPARQAFSAAEAPQRNIPRKPTVVEPLSASSPPVQASLGKTSFPSSPVRSAPPTAVEDRPPPSAEGQQPSTQPSRFPQPPPPAAHAKSSPAVSGSPRESSVTVPPPARRPMDGKSAAVLSLPVEKAGPETPGVSPSVPTASTVVSPHAEYSTLVAGRRSAKPASRHAAGSPALQPGPKPPILAAIPALFSLLPGLGQAFNLDVGRAVVFALLFVLSAVASVIKPGLGVPGVVLVIFLAMSDASGSFLGKSFFGGLWHGITRAWRLYFGWLGILFWTVTGILVVDSLGGWMGSGTTLVATLDVRGSGAAASRSVPAWLATILTFGGGLLFYFLHGFGRKFVWARKRRWHFLYALQIVFLALAWVGFMSMGVRRLGEENAGRVVTAILTFPFDLLQAVANLPQTVGQSLGQPWSPLAPEFFATIRTAGHSFGTGAVSSFTAKSVAYGVALVAGLCVFLPLAIVCMVRASRVIPAYHEWIEFWCEAVRARTLTLREQWEALRAEQAAAWQRRRENEEARQHVLASLAQHMARVENILDAIAQKQGVAIPPPASVLAVEQWKRGTSADNRRARLALWLQTAVGRMGEALHRSARFLAVVFSAAVRKTQEAVHRMKERQAQKAAAKATRKEAAPPPAAPREVPKTKPTTSPPSEEKKLPEGKPPEGGGFLATIAGIFGTIHNLIRKLLQRMGCVDE